MRSYVIHVNFQESTNKAEPATVSLFTQAKGTDLERLLRAFDQSPSVTSLSIFSTPTVPELIKLSKLAEKDLGIELSKLI
jgi:hypothetical protein